MMLNRFIISITYYVLLFVFQSLNDNDLVIAEMCFSE